VPSQRTLPKKTVDEDINALDGTSDFTELVKARIASGKIKEVAENMELTELAHLVAWLTVLRDKRVGKAEKQKAMPRRPRARL
jgi:hypothetical protein